MMGQRFYWLRLQNGFFSSRRVKKMRRMPGGDTNVVIYLKMQLASLCTGGVIEYVGLEDTLAEEIALDIDEDVEAVESCLDYLLKYGLAEEYSDGSTTGIILPYVEDNTGSESKDAQRKRRERSTAAREQEETKAETDVPADASDGSGTADGQSADNVHIKKDNVQKRRGKCPTEKEIEIEIEREKTIPPSAPPAGASGGSLSDATLEREFADLWAKYPRKEKRKAALAAYKSARRRKTDPVQPGDVMVGITNYNGVLKFEEQVGQPREKRYIMQGGTFFQGECWNDDFKPLTRDGPPPSEFDHQYDFDELEKELGVKR